MSTDKSPVNNDSNNTMESMDPESDTYKEPDVHSDEITNTQSNTDQYTQQPLNFNGVTLFKQPSNDNYRKLNKRHASISSKSTEDDNGNMDDVKTATNPKKPEAKKKKTGHQIEPPDYLQTQITLHWPKYRSPRRQRLDYQE